MDSGLQDRARAGNFADGSEPPLHRLDAELLFDAHTISAATFAPSGSNIGNNGADSFLYSNVFNFPSAYGGPPNKITAPSPVFINQPFFLPFNTVFNVPIPAPEAPSTASGTAPAA